MAGGTESLMGPVDGAEEGAVESRESLGSQSLHLGEDGFRIAFELTDVHVSAGIWVCA